MRWGRQRRQQQGQEQSTSTFSLFRLLPLSSWFSKLKHTRSEPEPSPPPPPGATAYVSRHRCQILPPSKPRTHLPELRPRAPPPGRFSPERARHRRPSSASDHLSFSPAVLDRLVGRGQEGITSPRRHSCGGDDAAAFFIRSRSRGERPFESARFHMASTEPRFQLPSCRSCRADPERQPGFFSRDSDVSSDTEREESEDDDDDCGRERGRRGPEAAPPRRKPVRGRKATGEGPSPPKDSSTPLKPSHGVLTGEVGWRSSGRTERSRLRRPSSPERTAAAQDQRASGARRSFSFGGKMRQRNRVKVYSPRAAAAAAAAARAARERNAYTSRKKVAAAEEKEEGRRGGKRRSLESFAVVKCSTDPQGDFRESMVEMIRQNGIGRPEEMEGLLACYLALNADEYHDVIVKVFRQVWLDLRTSPLLVHRSEFA